MRRLADRMRSETGVAMVLVVFAMALLATLSVVLVDTVTSESARSSKAVTKQSSFEAAEAGLDDYIAKLAEDRAYYLHWVHPAEATRRDTATSALVSPSGASPAPASWCRDPTEKPTPIAWTGGTTWLPSPNGKDHWCSLGNGYEYNLQITPPSASQPGVTVVSTGRKLSNTADIRVVEAVVRQSTIADFQRIVDGNVSWGSGAFTYGKLYANGNISHDGTAYGSIYATGSLSGSVSFQSGAAGYDGSGSTGYPNLFGAGSGLTNAIAFNSFLTSFSDISSAASGAGGIALSPTSVVAGGVTYTTTAKSSYWLTFNANATVSVKGCTGSSIETSNPSSSCSTITGSPYALPSNGAIYSTVNVIVEGTVDGQVTVASDDEILIGNTLLYDGDGGSFATPSYGVNVLGLEAKNDVVVPSWAPTDVNWRAAVLSQAGTWRGAGSTSNHNTMNHRGSSATADGGSFSGMFDTRNYYYDASLEYLPPPWFPTLDPNYSISSFRELPGR
jgi:Tfp pilus assembly protein PilX